MDVQKEVPQTRVCPGFASVIWKCPLFRGEEATSRHQELTQRSLMLRFMSEAMRSFFDACLIAGGIG
jgi:hypothetical protein